MFCLIIWVMKIVVFTPHDEHSQGERPHNSLHQRDCTYKGRNETSMFAHTPLYF